MTAGMRQLIVETPEGVSFAWPLAGPASRFFAWSIDSACVLLLVMLIQPLVKLAGVLDPDVSAALATLTFFVLQIGFSMVLEWKWTGQTVGKRVLRIRVIDASGMRLTPQQVVIRNLLRAADALPLLYAAGGLSCALTSHAQRLGDLAAGTVVIRHDTFAEPEVPDVLRLKYNSLRAHPHLALRLRQRSTPAEAGLALEALIRRDELEPSAREEVFSALRAHFEQKVTFPAEAVDGLSSEGYVRDVVDLLLEMRSRGARPEALTGTGR